MNLFFNRCAPFVALVSLTLGGCQPDLTDEPKPSTGQADFSRYLAVGNSLTAGFTDNGLYREGQLTSYPSLLAGQFAQVGGGAFVQPFFADAQAAGSGYLRLTGFTAPTPTAISAPIIVPVPGNGGRLSPVAPPYTKVTSAIHNFGVPGLRLADVQTAGLGNLATSPRTAQTFNPYFERITPDGSNQSYFQRIKAEATGTTFFSYWLGNNDVLLFALAGAAAGGTTRTDTFTLKTNRMLNALTASGAKGVVVTIPETMGLPFFTAVGPTFRATLALPANNVPSTAPFVYTTGLLSPGQLNTRVSTTVASIRDASGAGNLLLTLTASPYVSLYGQPTGKYWRDFYQQALPSLPPTVPSLAVFLGAMRIDTTKAFGQHVDNPFPSTLVLDATEQTAIATATTDYNTALLAAANARNLAVFNANTFFRTLTFTGLVTNTVANTAGFISGNLFSLDGVHPTPRGYAVIANEMIKAINAHYGAAVPGVDATLYRGVRFPN